MSEHQLLLQVLVILAAALIGARLTQRAGLGSILGYLIAGLAIGPDALALVRDEAVVTLLGAFGVVFLLFTIGLELPPHRLALLGPRTAALGLLQVGVTATVIALVAASLFALPTAAAVAVGLALALSSTAVVLRLQLERGAMGGPLGRHALAILLVQDVLVGPALVVVLALGREESAPFTELSLALLKLLVAVAAMLLIGRRLLRPLFRHVAAVRDPELFVALALAVVVAAAFAAGLAGLSMAFGAFLAGVMLADTPYRHQVSADIQPFRTLLLGLFFMSVGMRLDPFAIFAEREVILALLVGLLLVKALLLAGIARLLKVAWAQAVELGLLLAQAGEFAFVLLGAAAGVGLLGGGLAQRLAAVTALSLAVTPLLARLGHRLAGRMPLPAQSPGAKEEAAPGQARRILVVGMGRSGRLVAAKLMDAGQNCRGIDNDPNRMIEAREAGLSVVFGDATRPEILLAAGLERARAVVIMLDNPRAAVQCAALIHYVLPKLPVYARAQDERHAAELIAAGAVSALPEMQLTAEALAARALETLA